MSDTSDEYLVGRIQEALARDPRTHKQDVRVSVEGNWIYLRGTTTTEERRFTIASLVTELYPDRVVSNELEVLEVSAPGEPEVIK